MQDYIHSLMTDKIKGGMAGPLNGILYLVSLVYGIAIRARAIFYRFGIFKTLKVPMRIISVGNLTLGGTGKTPFVIALARILRDDLKKETSVLIRGYGWDEQAMLKKSLAPMPILVGENRVAAAHRAIRMYGSDAAILDDGFQYWELSRDLDIVLIDSRNPFGSGYLFPRGILRESKDALKRADVIVFTKVDKKRFDIDMIKAELKRLKEGLIFLEAVHSPVALYDLKAKSLLDLSYVKAKRVILISSIGDPEYFEEIVNDLGADVAWHVKKRDHHNYDEKDIKDIISLCDERALDFLVTTEKDAVKFNRLGLSFGKYPLLVLSIKMEITLGKENLVGRLHSLYSR